VVAPRVCPTWTYCSYAQEEYESIKSFWTTTTTTGTPKKPVRIQLAVVGPTMCIGFLDKNRLIQITCIQVFSTESTFSGPKTWYDTTLAPCPIMDIEASKTNLNLSQHQRTLRNPRESNAIYFELAVSKNNNLWSGTSTSHIVEILHLAGIYPE